MAVQIIHRLLSDLSGDEAQVTLRFGVDNKDYVIDLTDAESDAFRELIAPYMAAGQRADKSRKVTNAETISAVKVVNPVKIPQQERALQLKAIRDWGNARGMQVPARGRIPQSVMDMYYNRHVLEAAAVAQAAEKANKAANGAKQQLELDVVSSGVPVKVNGSKVKVPAGTSVVAAPTFSDAEKPKPAVRRNAAKAPTKVTRVRRSTAAR